METKELYRKFATYASPAELERMREEYGGVYGATTFRRTKDFDEILNEMGREAAMSLGREQTSETDYSHNIVTNEGLGHILASALGATAKTEPWYLTLTTTTATAESATMTAAVPVFTEITTTDVTNLDREEWTGGTPTGETTKTIANAAAVNYICNTTGFTAFGAALIGGGTIAFGNTAGVLYSYSLFGTSKVMADTDTIDVTYSFTSTDA